MGGGGGGGGLPFGEFRVRPFFGGSCTKGASIFRVRGLNVLRTEP